MTIVISSVISLVADLLKLIDEGFFLKIKIALALHRQERQTDAESDRQTYVASNLMSTRL